jgi:hypothetical protein
MVTLRLLYAAIHGLETSRLRLNTSRGASTRRVVLLLRAVNLLAPKAIYTPPCGPCTGILSFRTDAPRSPTWSRPRPGFDDLVES